MFGVPLARTFTEMCAESAHHPYAYVPVYLASKKFAATWMGSKQNSSRLRIIFSSFARDCTSRCQGGGCQLRDHFGCDEMKNCGTGRPQSFVRLQCCNGRGTGRHKFQQLRRAFQNPSSPKLDCRTDLFSFRFSRITVFCKL